MKTYYTLPEEEKKYFYNEYASLVSMLSLMGFLAQVISAITEFGIIYALSYRILSDFAFSGWVLAAFIAVIFVAFIEVGLRKFFSYHVRGVVNKRFRKGLEIWMFVFISIGAYALVLLSGTLSFKNSKAMVSELMPEAKEISTSPIDSTFFFEEKRVYRSFKNDSTEIVNRYRLQLNAAWKAANSEIDIKKKEIEGWRKREKPGRKYTTYINRLGKQIEQLEANRDKDILQLENQKAGELSQISKNRSQRLDFALNERISQKDSIDLLNATSIAETKQKVSNYGGGTAYFTLFCLALLLISVILDEIHKAGSGIKIEAEHSAYDFYAPIWQEFWQGLNERFQHKMREGISKMFNTEQLEQVSPQYGKKLFDPSRKQEVVRVVPNSLNNFEQLSDFALKTHYRSGPVQEITNNSAEQPESFVEQESQPRTDLEIFEEIHEGVRTVQVFYNNEVFGEKLNGKTSTVDALKRNLFNWYKRARTSATQETKDINQKKFDLAWPFLKKIGYTIQIVDKNKIRILDPEN